MCVLTLFPINGQDLKYKRITKVKTFKGTEGDRDEVQ